MSSTQPDIVVGRFSLVQEQTIAIATAAVALDLAGNYEAALLQYKTTLELLNRIIVSINNVQTKARAVAKFEQYLKRAEYMDWCVKQKSKPGPVAESSEVLVLCRGVQDASPQLQHLVNLGRQRCYTTAV